jgi:hypothetical protein
MLRAEMGHSANHGLASHTTLLPYKRRNCTTVPSHVDTPCSIHAARALVRPPRPSSRAGLAPGGERCHTKTSCMVPDSYISNETLAAALVPLRDHCARVIHRDILPPVGRRGRLGVSQPVYSVDGQFPGLTPGPESRNSLFRLPFGVEVRAALLASLVGTRTACG